MTARLQGARVLVVEDEALVALFVEDILVEHGAVVVGPATTIEQALSLISSESIDVGFLDVNLNGQRSQPIARQLRDRGVPFMFATGYGDADMEGLGDVSVISKPYRADQVVAALTALLADPRIPE